MITLNVTVTVRNSTLWVSNFWDPTLGNSIFQHIRPYGGGPFKFDLVRFDPTSGTGTGSDDIGYQKGKKKVYDMTSDMAPTTHLGCSTRQRHTHMVGALLGSADPTNLKIS